MADENIATPVVPDAGAAPVTTTTESGSTQDTGTAGADTLNTRTTEGGGSEQVADSTSQEGAQGVTEGAEPTSKGAPRLSLEERVNQLAEKKVAEKLQAELDKRQQAEAAKEIPFKNYNRAAVEAELLAPLSDRIALLNAEGRVIEARRLERQRDAIIDELEKDEQVKAEWEQKQQATQTQQQMFDRLQSEINTSTEVLRDHFKIPHDVFEEGRKWFNDKLVSDPILGRKYNEMVFVRGSMEAVEWAYNYTKENMGKETASAMQATEAAKNQIPPGKTSTVDPVAGAKVEELKAKALKSGKDEDFLAWKSAANAARTQT